MTEKRLQEIKATYEYDVHSRFEYIRELISSIEEAQKQLSEEMMLRLYYAIALFLICCVGMVFAKDILTCIVLSTVAIKKHGRESVTKRRMRRFDCRT